MTEKPAVVIESDASKRGWGETSRRVRMGRPWSREESQMHINCLEALAAFLVVKCFLREKSSRNVTALATQDEQHECSHICKQTRRNNITEPDIHNQETLDVVHAERHNPGSRASIGGPELCGIRRVTGDERRDRLEAEQVFRCIDCQIGPLAVDLFGSRLIAQLP